MSSNSRPLILRGSLIPFKRKCGKPTCRCANGEPHESPALSCTIEGKSYTITLSKSDVPVVKAALARFDKQHAALEQACKDGLSRLQSLIKERKAGA